MPAGGALTSSGALPSGGNEESWREADWQWDPVAMTATPRPTSPAGAAIAACLQPAALQAGSSAAVRLHLALPPSMLTHAGDSADATAAEGPAAVVLPAAGTPGTSSGDGSGGGAPALAPAPAGEHKRGGGGGTKQRKGASGANSGPVMCQADGCGADLRTHTYYHQRNKICSVHIKADVFLRKGEQLRFCQRCGHPHLLNEFDPGKHSCRKQLEKHNARRRKRQEQAAEAKAAAGADGTPAPGEGQAAAAGAAKKQAQQAAKRSRQAAPAAKPAGAAARGASGPLEAPTADAVEAFEAALAASKLLGGAGRWPSAGLQDESGSAGDPAEPASIPVAPSLALPALGPGQQAAAAARQHDGSPPLPAHSGPAASFGTDTSASLSAAAGSQPAGGGQAGVQQQRLASPPLPVLDFELDLKPTPYDELFSQPSQPLSTSDGGLAADLEAWLNANLAEERQQAQRAQQQAQAAAAQQAQQAPQQLWQLVSGVGPSPQQRAASLQPGWPQAQPSSLQLAHSIVTQQPMQPDPLLPPPGLGYPPAQHQQQQYMPQPPYQQQQYGYQPHPAALLPPNGGSGMLAPYPAPPMQQQHMQPQRSVQPSPHSPAPTLATISVKLFGCTPAELPPGLRDQLKGWFDGAVHSLDGYLRPGCVHLTAQAVVDGAPAAEAGAGAQAQAGGGQQQQAPALEAAPPAAGGQPQAEAAQQAVPAVEGTASEAAAPAVDKAAQLADAEAPARSCCQKAAAAGKEGAAVGAPHAEPAEGPATAAAATPAGAAGPACEASNSPACSQPPAPTPPADVVPAARACCSRKRPADGAAAELAGASDSAVRRVVDRMLQSGEALWRTKTMLVQTGRHVALVHQGRLKQTWDIEGPSSRAVPAILDVSPPLLLASQPAPLRVSGVNMLQNDCRLLLRLQGRYVQPAVARCDSCTCSAPVHPGSAVGFSGQAAAALTAASFEQRCCGCCVGKLQLAGLVPPAPAADAAAAANAAVQGAAATQPPSCCAAQPPAASSGSGGGGRRVAAGAARLQSVRLHLPDQLQQRGEQQEPLLPGLLHLDVQRRAYSAPRGARVLVVSSPAVHRELLLLVERCGPQALPPPLLDQLGMVHEWVGRPEKMQYQLVEATAARLLYWAVARGLPATAELLLSVLQAQGGTSSSAAAAVLQRALRPELGAAADALSTMDALSRLHLSVQATSAAAMQRAAELACHDGLSLLHRAVQSRCGATLRAVLSWGEDAGTPWRCDLAGPMGVTPLHLAAMLPDPAAARNAVLLLLGRCVPGAEAWTACCTADGHSPAHFYRAAAAARCGGDAAAAEAAVSGLETEVAVLAQLQQQARARTQPLLALQPAAKLAALGSAPTAHPLSAPPHQQQYQQQYHHQQQQQPQAAAQPLAAQPAPAPLAGEVGGEEMQPGTPRKNPGCLCAPGCPCALLDSCACCGSDSEEDSGWEGEGHPHHTCGSGSGKCCCCSKEASNHLPGCAGCAAGGASPSDAAGGGGGGCCGGGARAAAQPAAPVARSCCGGGGK